MSTRSRDLSPPKRCTTRDGSLNGRPRRNKSLIKLKIVVFAPMASASVTTAMMVNPGVLASVRSAYLKSDIIRIGYLLGDHSGERGRRAKNVRSSEHLCTVQTLEPCRARRTTQRARRPRCPEVVVEF